MNFILLALTLAVASLAGAALVKELGQPNEAPPLDNTLDSRWTEYKGSFSKVYSNSADERYRYNKFSINQNLIYGSYHCIIYHLLTLFYGDWCAIHASSEDWRDRIFTQASMSHIVTGQFD